MSKYSVVYIFTKRTSLHDFLDTDKVLGSYYNNDFSQASIDNIKRRYEREQDVNLIAMFRWEKTPKGNKCFCKIKCPINPLPIKGEFETPGSTTPVIDFLKANRWEFKQKIHSNVFE